MLCPRLVSTAYEKKDDRMSYIDHVLFWVSAMLMESWFYLRLKLLVIIKRSGSINIYKGCRMLLVVDAPFYNQDDVRSFLLHLRFKVWRRNKDKLRAGICSSGNYSSCAVTEFTAKERSCHIVQSFFMLLKILEKSEMESQYIRWQ